MGHIYVSQWTGGGSRWKLAAKSSSIHELVACRQPPWVQFNTNLHEIIALELITALERECDAQANIMAVLGKCMPGHTFEQCIHTAIVAGMKSH
jgi:hypothetical protein